MHFFVESELMMELLTGLGIFTDSTMGTLSIVFDALMKLEVKGTSKLVLELFSESTVTVEDEKVNFYLLTCINSFLLNSCYILNCFSKNNCCWFLPASDAFEGKLMFRFYLSVYEGSMILCKCWRQRWMISLCCILCLLNLIVLLISSERSAIILLKVLLF